MEQKYCFGCMREITEAVCPHCGWDSRQENLPHQLPVGTVLAENFLVGRVLGQGGFGITYIGRDLNLDTVVAIKEFFPASAVNRDSSVSLRLQLNSADTRGHYENNRDRFLREARMLARLIDEPEVVSVRNLFEENDTAYIIMEYLQGQDLRHYVRSQGGKISPEILMPLMEPVLLALDKVHKAGLIHRDISPDNIMILPDGGVKLLDFGAVRVFDNTDADIDLSHSTEAILKHGFAPMEQYRSRGNLGPWTDEYGICASYYYCLTGKLPPDAPARAMGDEDVDWSLVSGLSEAQIAALRKGMSMRAKDRFGDVEALRKALYEQTEPVKIEETKETEITSVTLKKKSRGGLIAATLLLVTAIAAGVLWFVNREKPDHVVEVVPPETEVVEITLATEEQLSPILIAPTEMETEPTEDVYVESWMNNVMAENVLDLLPINRMNIESVTFLDTTAEAPANIVDVSVNQDGSVLAWYSKDKPRVVPGSYAVTFAAEGGINGKYACENLFKNCNHLRFLNFTNAFHTSDAISMAGMFYGCRFLTEMDLSYFNTSSVTDMSYMFYQCGFSDEIIDLRHFDVSNVRNMSYMFAESFDAYYDEQGFAHSPVLQIETWNMRYVEDISYMFCETLSSILLGKWDLQRVKNMSHAFEYCYFLSDVDVSDWDVSSVRDMSYAFSNSNIDYIDVRDWDVSEVTKMNHMFYQCDALSDIDVSGWDVSSVEDMNNMFFGCKSMTYIEVSQWDVSNVKDVSWMFYGCENLAIPDVSNWNTTDNLNYQMFLKPGTMIDGRPWSSLFES